MFLPFIVISIVLLFASCTGERELLRDQERTLIFRSNTDLEVYMQSDITWVEQTLARLSIEEKIGQMLVPRASTHYVSSDSRHYRELIRYIDSLKVGGLIFARGDVSEMALLSNELQERSDIPLLISADFEWGTAMRVRRGTLFPVAMAIGATRNPVYSYEIGKAIAHEARAVGVHQNFGPVADVNTNPRNPVINVRSFSEDIDLVNELAQAYMDGLHAGGVISTAKHFPGHGDTDVDSHLDLPLLAFDEARLHSIELAPFQYVINRGVMSIMSAHIAVPVLGEEEALPATLSNNIMHRLLQEEMQFPGLVVTDALEMRAITRNYPPDEAAILAVEAGNDMLLLPPDIDIAFESILNAVQSGRISEERIDRSVRRILMMKYWAGLHRERFVDVPGHRDVVASNEHRELAREVARNSITLVRNNADVLPLNAGAYENILVVILTDREGHRVAVHRPESSAMSEPVGAYFARLMQSRYDNVEVVRLDPRSNKIEYDSLMNKVSEADFVIGASHVQTRSNIEELTIPEKMQEALVAISEQSIPFALVSFGDPYFIENIPAVDAYICAYSGAEVSIEAAVETIAGIHNPTGRLPVTIPDIAPFGTGLIYTDFTDPVDTIAIPDEEEIPEIEVD